jgi:hypothetical protein
MLDWKITDAPHQDEARPEVALPPPSPHRRGWPRGALLLVGSVIVLVMVGAGLYSWWTRTTTRLAVQQALAQEASAVSDENIEQIRTLYGTSDSDWDVAYTRWALAGQAAPRPLPFLYPLTTTGQLRGLEPFAPSVLRAEVAHPFTNTQGQVLTFTTTYFFAFANDSNAWQRIEPPAHYWGEQRAYVGPYLTILYWEPDQSLVDELGPFLDNLLNQLCAEWECPADYKYELNFTGTLPNPLSLLKPPEEARPTDPLFFDVLAAFRSSVRTPALRLASPRVMGYPSDALSRAYFQRALGWQMLEQTSVSLGYDQTQSIAPLLNPMYYGVLAEIGQRLGLETALPDTPLIIDEMASLDFSRDLSLTDDEARGKLRPALAFIHRLIRDEAPGTTARLLRALWEDTTELDWIATGLNLNPTQAQARFDESMRDAIQIQSRVAGDFDWALACSAGPAVLSLEDGLTQYLLTPADATANFYYGGSTAWADDGQRMLVSGYGLLANLATGRIHWVASPHDSYGDRYTFINEDVVAYLDWPAGDNPELQNPRLRFYNVRDPYRTPPLIENVWNYVVSPDRQWLALSQLVGAGDYFSSASLSLIPAGGGPPRWTGPGAYPTWSPDSQQLVYAEYASDGRWQVMHRLDLASAESQVVINRSSLGSPTDISYAQAVWSPDGEWLVVVIGGEASGYQLWRMRPDGSEAQIIFSGKDYIGPPQFSADGQYLATMVYPPPSNGELHLMRMPTGEVIQTVTGLQAFAWSVSGHQLAVATFQGLHWLTEPTAEPRKLNNSVCYSIAWNPQR